MRLLASLFLIVFASACSQMPHADYPKSNQIFDPEVFFKGDLTAHGVVKNWRGQAIRHFNATINAYWQGETGFLDESFVFDDGEKQKRLWRLEKQPDGSFIATANDVVGESLLTIRANVALMKYVLQVPYNDSTIDITVQGRMYLIDDNTLIAESDMTKWGLKVGEVVLVIKR